MFKKEPKSQTNATSLKSHSVTQFSSVWKKLFSRGSFNLRHYGSIDKLLCSGWHLEAGTLSAGILLSAVMHLIGYGATQQM